MALDLGNDVNAVDNNGETAMHGAAYKNLPGAVEFLADARRQDRGLEPQEQAGLDAADHRGGLPVREFQAVARDRGRDSPGDDRRGRDGGRGPMNRAIALLTALALFASAGFAQVPCERLASVAIPRAAITVAGPSAADPAKQVPAHCRVAAVLTPTADSHIEMEVVAASRTGTASSWGWATAGGPAASASARMAAALREGYATASTDTGHKSAETPGASFAFGHPEKLIDYGYRAVHEMTVVSKALIAGALRQAGAACLLEQLLQRRPAGVDGGAALPGGFRRHRGGRAGGELDRPGAAIAVGGAVRSCGRGARTFRRPSIALLHDAALQACDALDGVKDGIIEDPMRCRFDPATLRCPEARWAGVPDGRAGGDGAQDLYRRARTSIRGWSPAANSAGPRTAARGRSRSATITAVRARSGIPRGIIRSLDAASAVPRSASGATTARPMRSIPICGLLRARREADPVSRLERSADPADAQRELLRKRAGEDGRGRRRSGFYRLFMVPGMQHCGGGSGAESVQRPGSAGALAGERQAPRASWRRG